MDQDRDKQIQRLEDSLDALVQRLDQLAARVETLEGSASRVGDSPRVPQPSPPIASTPTPPTTAAAPPPASLATPPTGVSPSLPIPKSSASETASTLSSGSTPSGFVKQDLDKRETIQNLHTRVSRPKPKASNFEFRTPEWLRGTRGLIFVISLIGGLIVLVGVGYFLKYAYDEGWIGQISPTARCVAAAVFGFALVGAGEVFRRKINPLSSSGISAAGIAVLYAAILTAAKMYELIDTPIAFGLLVVVTVGGIVLGSLSNRVMLAFLSLAGAFMAPVLLSTGEPSYTVFPAYLISLLVLGLVLSGWRGGSYSHVRRLAWWGTGILGTIWLADMHGQAPTSSLVFASLVWLVTIVELVASSRFFGTIRDQTKWPETSQAGFLALESGERTFDLRSLWAPEARWINSLFGVTAWAVGASALTIRKFNPELDFVAPLGFGIASVVIGFLVLSKKRDGDNGGLWAQRASPRSALASALTVNAALLVVATVATALGGWVQIIAWATIGLAAIETASRIRFRAAGLFGFALLTIAVGRLILYDFGIHLQADASVMVLGIAMTAWSAQVAAVGAACAAAAWRSRYKVEGSVGACVALWLVGWSLVHVDTAVNSLGPALVVLAAIAGWVSVGVRIRGLRTNAFVLAGIGTGIALVGQFAISGYATIEPEINAISMVIMGVAWSGLAAMRGAAFGARWVCASLAVGAGVVAIGQTVESLGTPEALVLGVLYTAVVAALGIRLVRWALMEIAAVLLCVMVLGWAAYSMNLGSGVFDGSPIVHWGFVSAILGVAVAVGVGLGIPKLAAFDDAPESFLDTRRLLRKVAFGLGWALLLASTSIEAERGARAIFVDGAVRGAGVSIWWSLFAVGSVVAGFRMTPALRWAGLGLLGAVAFKVLAFDTQVLNLPARVVAAISVGLVIIGTGVIYARLAEKTGDENDGPEHLDEAE